MDDSLAPARLDDAAVRRQLAVLNEQLAQLEATPGPVGELALTAVAGLAEIYGQALVRTLEAADPPAVERMLGDELIGHLLALHGIHPEPIAVRLAKVVEDLHTDLAARAGTIALDRVEDGVAALRVAVGGCASSMADIEKVVRRAVLTAVPELHGVRVTVAEETGAAVFVPLDTLMRSAASAPSATAGPSVAVSPAP